MTSSCSSRSQWLKFTDSSSLLAVSPAKVSKPRGSGHRQPGVLALQTPILLGHIGRHAGLNASFDLGLVLPNTQRVWRDTKESANVVAPRGQTRMLGTGLCEHAECSFFEFQVVFLCHRVPIFIE